MRWTMLWLLAACTPHTIEQVLEEGETEPSAVEPHEAPPETETSSDGEPMTVCGRCDPTAEPFGAGAGTVGDPHLICSAQQLDALRSHNATRAMICEDLDIAGLEPIRVFRGVLDGDGHSLTGWTFDEPEASGVAFVIELQGVLRDLRFTDVSMSVYSDAAVAVHHTAEDARIEEVHVEGVVSAASGHVAGVVGTVAEGTEVVSASFRGQIHNLDFGYVGGVVDRCAGTCRKLVAEGELSTDAWKAGCVAQTVEGLLEGGICRMDMHVRNRSGGIAGELLGGTIRASYFEGTMEGDYWLGGIVGEAWEHDGRVEQSYAAGEVHSSREHSGVGAAGLVAWPGAPVALVDALWDHQRGPHADTIGGLSLTTEEMQDPDHEAFATWAGWHHVRGDYPRLPWEEAP